MNSVVSGESGRVGDYIEGRLSGVEYYLVEVDPTLDGVEYVSDEVAVEVEAVLPGGPIGKIIERLDLRLDRILRSSEFTNDDILEGVRTGAFVRFTREEMLASISREHAGIGMTGGGDCAGIADCLSSMCKNLDPEKSMLGIRNAGRGLSVAPDQFDNQLVLLDPLLAGHIEGQSSTPLGSARVNALKTSPENTMTNIDGYDFFYGTGGDDHLGLLENISEANPEMTVVGTFKSIDGDGSINDVPAQMLGFKTAVGVYRSAISAALQNADTHDQITVVELFGRKSGKLAFESARRHPSDLGTFSREEKRKIEDFGDSTVILVPEKPASLLSVAREVKRVREERGNCVIVAAEGFMPPELHDLIVELSVNEEVKNLLDGDGVFVNSISYYLAVWAADDISRLALLTLFENDHELARVFVRTVLHTTLDDFGNSVKLAGIRKFIISAISHLTEYEKVNEMLLNYEARGATPSEYDQVMGRKIGKKMAEVVNDELAGGRAVVYFEGMDAMLEDPRVVPLKGVGDKNTLKNADLYSDDMLRENGVFWEV